MIKKIIAIFLTVFVGVSCSFGENKQVKNELQKYYDSTELEKLVTQIKNGENVSITIVDVRPKNIYQKSHIPTAINIPNGITNGLYEELKNKDLILYCETGMRVEFAKKNMIKDGFSKTNLLNFGGFSRYKGEVESSK